MPSTSFSANVVDVVEPATSSGHDVMAAMVAAETRPPTAEPARVPTTIMPFAMERSPQAAPPTAIRPVALRAIGEEDAATTESKLAHAPPTAAFALAETPSKKSGGRFTTGVLLGLLAGLAGGLAIRPFVVTDPQAAQKGPITTYLEGAQALAAEQKYDAALELLERVRGMHPPDAAVNVRLVNLTTEVGLAGAVAHVKRAIALGDPAAANDELRKLGAFDPPTELITQLRAQIDGKPAPAAASPAPVVAAPAPAAATAAPPAH